jgi:hypothetical protein
MMIPLQITFRHTDPSPVMEARIRELAARLERFSEHIMRCHVIVEPPPRHQHQGALHDIRIDITSPFGTRSARRDASSRITSERPVAM